MADLTVTITESVTINGAVRGSTNELTTSDIIDTFERTITCTHSQTTIVAEFGATPHAAGSNLDRDNVKYFRITNLDATNESLKLTKIEHLGKSKIQTLSGGENQKVLISMSVAQNTPITLLDEPTSNLDIDNPMLSFRNQLMQKAFRNRGSNTQRFLMNLSFIIGFEPNLDFGVINLSFACESNDGFSIIQFR